MNRFVTLMIIPDRARGVKSWRLPRPLFHSLLFIGFIGLLLTGIFTYDYIVLLKQVHRHKHLDIENQHLKEQIQLFQMKINTLASDLDRMKIFEKKVRVVFGLEEMGQSNQILPRPIEQGGGHDFLNQEKKEDSSQKKNEVKKAIKSSYMPSLQDTLSTSVSALLAPAEVRKKKLYQELKTLYEQKMASKFGILSNYEVTKLWSDLTQQSFGLAKQFALFDYRYNLLKNEVQGLELSFHKLDKSKLNRESFGRSTPSLLPTKGWITSFYGPRKSPYSGRIKMHEGIDIGARRGEGILAAADGRVTYSGKKPGYGLFVQINHGYGVETIYAHAKKLIVKRGSIVKRGQLLAKVGSTGYSTGPHTHYEVRVNGVPVDPLYFVFD